VGLNSVDSFNLCGTISLKEKLNSFLPIGICICSKTESSPICNFLKFHFLTQSIFALMNFLEFRAVQGSLELPILIYQLFEAVSVYVY
jgi:hypothetical protein